MRNCSQQLISQQPIGNYNIEFIQIALFFQKEIKIIKDYLEINDWQNRTQQIIKNILKVVLRDNREGYQLFHVNISHVNY